MHRTKPNLFFATALVSLGISLPALSRGDLTYDQYHRETGLPARAVGFHFTVFARDEALARRAQAVLEETLRRIMGQLNLKKVLNKPCLVFIWGDQKEYVNRAGQFFSGDIETVCGFFQLRAEGEPSRIFLYQGDALLNENLPHELGHLVLEAVFDPLRKYNLPLWMHEGFAQVQERDDHWPGLIRVRRAAEKNRLLPLKMLFAMTSYPSKALEVQLFYLESDAVVRFLLESQVRPDDFERFCSEFLFWKKSPGEVIKNYFGGKFPDPAALQERMISWIGEKAAESEIEPDNRFLDPHKRYAAAQEYIVRAEAAARAGRSEEAAFTYESAIDELAWVSVEDPGWKQPEVGRLLSDCRGKHAALRAAAAEASPQDAALKSRSDFFQGRMFSLTDRNIREMFGEPSTLEKSTPEGGGYDRFRLSYAKYRDLGLDFVFQDGLMISARAIAPFAGSLQGVRIGDSLEQARSQLKSKFTAQNAFAWDHSGWIHFKIPSGECWVYNKYGNVVGLEVRKRDPFDPKYGAANTMWNGSPGITTRE